MFIGRAKERKLLDDSYKSDRFEFTVIYGRRRIGKTELIKQYIKDKRAVYFMALQSTEQSNLEMLSKALFQFEGRSNYATFPSYNALFDYVGEISKDRPLVLVIDEYPYLAQVYSEISSIIQSYCDGAWKSSKLHLILCGSSMSFMENQVLGAKSPLYGRRTSQIKLKQFNFFETEEYLYPMSKEDIAILHCATGGIAEYLTFIDRGRDIDFNLVNLFFNTFGRLYEEPVNYLKQEMREPKIYNTILDTIAKGYCKIGDISNKISMQTGSVSKYLDNLIELGIVIKEAPIGEDSNRKTLYRIGDGSFRFWYKFVFPNMSPIQIGLGEKLYKEHIKKELSDFMGEGFEGIFVDYFDKMNERGEFPSIITKRGRWWGNNPKEKREEEIDLVGIGKGVKVFCEVKWTTSPIDSKVIKNLLHKSDLHQSESKYYILFSKAGFTQGAIDFAKNRIDITLKSFL